jgi:hypothetical protein
VRIARAREGEGEESGGGASSPHQRPATTRDGETGRGRVHRASASVISTTPKSIASARAPGGRAEHVARDAGPAAGTRIAGERGRPGARARGGGRAWSSGAEDFESNPRVCQLASTDDDEKC